MARSRTVLKKMSSVTQAEYNVLIKKNMHNAGAMQMAIYHGWRDRQWTDDQVVIHYDEVGKIDGWAYVFGGDARKAWFYVSPPARRKGIGTKLANRVRKINPMTRTDPWDKRSAKFFQKNQLLDKGHSWLLE